MLNDQQKQTSSGSWNMEHQAGFHSQCGNKFYNKFYYVVKYILLITSNTIDKVIYINKISRMLKEILL